jgi:hypothetical protein
MRTVSYKANAARLDEAIRIEPMKVFSSLEEILSPWRVRFHQHFLTFEHGSC